MDVQWKASGEPDYSKCWAWRAVKGTGSDGKYGKFWFAGKYRKAHRIAFLLHYRRKIPKHLDGGHVPHCAHAWCNNPTHIRPASKRANQQEMWMRRKSRGPDLTPVPDVLYSLAETERIEEWTTFD